MASTIPPSSTPTAASSLPSSHSTSQCLCPGYKQVDEFGPDEDYEDDEEVTYVTLDLGPIEPTLIPSSSTYRLIGLDTPTPFLQLSGTILKGRHESLLGTELIFTEAKDAQNRSKRHLNFVATTEQRIRFREVRLQPKSTQASASNGDPMDVDEPPASTKLSAKDKGKGRADPRGGSDLSSAPQTAEASTSSTTLLNRMTGKEQAPAHPKRRASRKKKAPAGDKSEKVSKRKSTSSKGAGKGKEKEKEQEKMNEDQGDVDVYADDGEGNVEDPDFESGDV